MPPPCFSSAATRYLEMEAVGAVEVANPTVVAGIDLSLPLRRLSDAVVHVRNGAQLIVTNPDLTVPIKVGSVQVRACGASVHRGCCGGGGDHHRQAASSGYLPASALLDGPRGA